MSVTLDILTSYRRPGPVVGRHLAAPAHEGRALAWLIIGCALIFVAQLPRLSREVALSPETGLAERASGELVFWLFFAPLIFYALAVPARLIARGFRARISWYGARVATFWALLASTPLWLLRGLTAAMIGPGPALDLITLLAIGFWLAFWGIGLREASRMASPIAPADNTA